ncbi:MAG: hydroxymethylbilane synthase [Rhodobacteraceae bacterium]|nr:hydroxymethylbilane synthase [Paracoccaceae bacterium]
MADTVFRMGSRASRLALAQAREAQTALCTEMDVPKSSVPIIPISTKGDRVQDRPFRQIGGKGVFCRDLELALLDRTIDIAVHSLKDMPVQQPSGLIIDCVLRRSDPRDALISRTATCVAEIGRNDSVGTSSVRRQAQLRRIQPQLKIVELRGNIDTRIEKWDRGDAAHLILAMAGLKRLAVDHVPIHPIPVTEMLPAPGQGIICLERRCSDRTLADAFSRLNDRNTALMAAAERHFLAGLGGSCELPVGALALIEGECIELTGEHYPRSDSWRVSGMIADSFDNAKTAGRTLARRLIHGAGRAPVDRP